MNICTQCQYEVPKHETIWHVVIIPFYGNGDPTPFTKVTEQLCQVCFMKSKYYAIVEERKGLFQEDY